MRERSDSPVPEPTDREFAWLEDAGAGPLINRRDWLKLMAASLALAGLPGCSRPEPEDIVPYVRAPRVGTEGEPRHHATAVLHNGYAQGVLATSYMGRPVKLEGNPHHPESRGAGDVFTQAEILQLWDPGRESLITRAGQPADWDALQGVLAQRRPRWKADGRGLRILTETLTSPSLAAQLEALEQEYPGARWHQYQPINDDNAQAGARLAFGEVVEPRWRLEHAAVILAVDADPLGPGPEQTPLARGFAEGRRRGEQGGEMSRLYAIEPSPSLTGAAADHRLALPPGYIGAWLNELARTLGADLPPVPLPETARAWVAPVAADLRERRGAGAVLVGRGQPPAVHALGHWINHRLGNVGHTLDYQTPVPARVEDHTGSLAELARAMRAGEVDTLLILGGNPVYNAPVDLDLAEALARVPLSVHLGLYPDETSAHSTWHVPLAHPLESWGDARSPAGHVSLLQPLIAPLYGGRSPGALLDATAGRPAADDHERLRDHWRNRADSEDFEAWWRQALLDGVVADSAAPLRKVEPRADLLRSLERIPQGGTGDARGLSLHLAPDATIWDGRYAGLSWLQELPKPLTQLTWDNAALIAPLLARRHGLESGDVVELRTGAGPLEAAVWITPGQAEDVISLSLGYGRGAGLGRGHGANAYRLRTSGAPWSRQDLDLHPLSRHHPLASTQAHHRLHERHMVRHASLEEFRADPQFAREGPAEPPSLYPSTPPGGAGEHAWGMAINLNSCIGCGACTAACQAENNIPVVGKEEVMRGREMHWIRVDRYLEGPEDTPRTLFQPVPCMHCEHAPCELVCPVGATMHDAEGLNVQVYNRCIGTRFCSNNCPYKVRRFNFLQYAEDRPALNARRNPEVTVRQRGVMEKCTYCIQRIERARIEAHREDRPLAEGEVVTACQAVCPTGAIVFGDLNHPDSAVRRAKASPLDYSMLAELNTRPRTTYGARLRNPNPALPEPGEGGPA